MHSPAVLEERLKQNAKLHSLKLFMRVLKIYVRGENEGREWKRREERGGEGRERKGREGKGGKGEKGKRGGKREMGRECKQTNVNEKQLTSFPRRGVKIETV